MSRKADVALLRFYGHSAFECRTPRGIRILIDPYRNPPLETGRKWFFQEFPRVKADLVLVSHPHFDHDAVDRVIGTPSIIRSQGEFRGADFSVQAIPDRHAGEYGVAFNHFNLIFIVHTAGIVFCHMGDNRADVPTDVRGRIGEIDVLMISVDGSQHLLAYEEVDSLIDLLDPKVVVSMHYLIPGLTHPDSTLETVDSWLETRERAKRITGEEVWISTDSLPGSREVWFFEEYAK